MTTTEPRIQYEVLRDVCPVCGSHGMAPCYDEQGANVPDHEGRPIEMAATGE